MPSVSAVFVTWNSLEWLPRAFAALERQTCEVAEVVVVDNGSNDGTLDWLRARGGVRLIENGANRGFAAANNQGIAVAEGAHVLVINTDVFLEPTALEVLVARLEADSGLGAVGPKLLRPATAAGGERLIDTAGERLFRTLRFVNRGEEEPDRGQYDAPEEVFGISAAAVLFRRALLDDLREGDDFFDPLYVSYLEDSDLCWRARLRGWRLAYEPRALGVHVRQHATSRSIAIQRRALANRYRLVLKNAGWRELLRATPHLLVYEAFRALKTMLREPRLAGAYLIALRGLPSTLRERRRVQRSRRVSHRAIWRWSEPERYLAQLAYRLGFARKPADRRTPAARAENPTQKPRTYRTRRRRLVTKSTKTVCSSRSSEA